MFILVVLLLLYLWQESSMNRIITGFSSTRNQEKSYNAGFDLFGQQGQSSLQGYRNDALVNLVIAGLIFLGGLGVPVWKPALRFQTLIESSQT
jgi:Trk-type K+ transport system membrane component